MDFRIKHTIFSFLISILLVVIAIYAGGLMGLLDMFLGGVNFGIGAYTLASFLAELLAKKQIEKEMGRPPIRWN